MKPKKAKREVIQKALAGDVASAVEKAVKALDLDLNDKDIKRRIFRAIVGAASGVLYDAGAHPKLVLQEASRACVEEFMARQEAAVMDGQLFGALPDASA